MAKFKFKHAVMSAGKSQELARVRYNYIIKGEKVLVLVPSTDNRHGIGMVRARSGESFEATSVNPGEMEEWLANYFKDTNTTAEDYDIVYTGDLGRIGTDLLYDLMDKKGCREKQCKYLVKNEGHPYFEIKARNKLIKKAKKDGKSTYVYNGVTYLIT